MMMIGVSTGQNITNLIPAVQKGKDIDQFVIIETTTAIRGKWSEGLEKVLKSRNIRTKRLSLAGVDSAIDKIYHKLKDFLSNHKEPVVWNIGGGQKVQQIPIWDIFKYRNLELNIPDIICYANQDDKGKLEIWEYKEGRLANRNEAIEVDLTAEEIFNVFGYEVEKGAIPIYKKGTEINLNKLPDLLHFQEFRQFMYEIVNFFVKQKELTFTLDEFYQIIKANSKILDEEISTILEKNMETIFQSNLADTFINCQNNKEEIEADFRTQVALLLAKGLRKKLYGNKDSGGRIHSLLRATVDDFTFPLKDMDLNKALKKIVDKELKEMPNNIISLLGCKEGKSGFYFEQIMIERVKELLEKTEHHIIEAYANLKVKQQNNLIAEYDILCVTRMGTVIALDAKTFDFEKKEIDARLYNLQKGSGYYRSFSAIFPYDIADLNQSWFKQVRKLPFDLKNRTMSFYVVTHDNRNDSFWVKFDGTGQMEHSEKIPQDKENWVECRPWQNFIKQR